MTYKDDSGERDLTIGLWHRYAFGEQNKAFDLDLVGVEKTQPVYAIEATRSKGHKATSYLQAVTRKLEIPAFLVQYETVERPCCQACGRPQRVTAFDPDDMRWSKASRVLDNRRAVLGEGPGMVGLDALRDELGNTRGT